MYIKRRSFLQMGSLASATVFIPKILQAFEQPLSVPAGNKVLVVIQLSGGNDGLNTVIPYRNDIYYKSRPRLGITREKAIQLNDEVGLHPALTAIKSLYDEGNVSILNSVGYENPDRSHFRSMDIWHSASKSREYWYTGWLGRYLDHACQSCHQPTQALEMDDVLSLALKGEKSNALALKDPKRLYGASQAAYFKALSAAHHHDHEQPVEYLYQTLAQTVSSADYIFQQSKLRPTRLSYPTTETGQALKTISSLIASDINTKVYYLSLGSFDTHVNQSNQQERLFKELNAAIEVFTKDMKAMGRFEDVLMMTFSEFGRRVNQNASGGTDHGTANNMFFVGGGLKQKGLLNAMPDLTKLVDGDLQYQVDFKSVYATVLERWLGVNSKEILMGEYPQLSFL